MVNKMLLQSGKTTSQLYGITGPIKPKCQGLHEEIGVAPSLAVDTNIQDDECSVNRPCKQPHRGSRRKYPCRTVNGLRDAHMNTPRGGTKMATIFNIKEGDDHQRNDSSSDDLLTNSRRR